nr:immunoglobulin heavy chain junction region [Mus musculus]
CAREGYYVSSYGFDYW